MGITQEYLKQRLDYNPDTGIFVWRKNTQIRFAGKVAGSIHANGYIVININGKILPAHRLAFLYMKGYFPENDCDHINRIRDDNRWSNLREVSKQCNTRNSKTYSTNTSGVRGVSWYKTYNKWVAQIILNNKQYGLGYFKDFTEAVCYRLAAEQCLEWEGCDSNSPAYLYIKEIFKWA